MYCENVVSKANVARHLAGCAGRRQAIERAEQNPGTPETLIHLRVQDKYRGEYWLDLEARGSSTLASLDDYLRAIWLECCNHLSQFGPSLDSDRTIPMSWRMDRVFRPKVALVHVYDFGTSSLTRVNAVATREGKATTKRPIALMARNLLPEMPCVVCGKPATRLCHECINEENTSGALCEKHAQNHPHVNYGRPIRLVNSPRMGLCGYDGPAQPPY
jgi:hypothetical protein